MFQFSRLYITPDIKMTSPGNNPAKSHNHAFCLGTYSIKF